MTDQEIVFGVHEDHTPSATAERFPGVRLDRVFFRDKHTTGMIHAHDRMLEQYHGTGIDPIVSWKIAPHRLNDRDLERTLVDYGVFLHAYAQHSGRSAIRLVYFHEPENDMDGRTFVAAFDRFRSLVMREAPSVQVGHVAMAYQWWPGRASTREALQWRVEKADFFGIDVYSGGSAPARVTVWEHEGVQRWWEELVVPLGGVGRWLVTERGFAGSVSDEMRARVIRRERRGLRDPFGAGTAPLGVVYWSSRGAEQDRGKVFGPRAEAAVRAVI